MKSKGFSPSGVAEKTAGSAPEKAALPEQPFSPPAAAEPLLTVRALSASYRGDDCALESVSFSLQKGERVAVIGSSGSGKSTLLKCINGSLVPREGELRFGHQLLSALSPRALRKLRRSIGFIFQEYNLIGRKTVIENVLYGRLGFKNFWQSLFSLYTDEEYRAAVTALRAVSLSEKCFARADELSGGQKQRVAIARILVQNPLLLMADEPVSALDPVSAENVLGLFCRINEEHGISLLANLHDVRLARRYFPRIIALKQGRKIYDGSSGAITESILRTIYGEKNHEQN